MAIWLRQHSQMCLNNGSCSAVMLATAPFRQEQRVLACHAGNPVTDGTMLSWKGFVSLILGAYFEKRMAWYPVVRFH